MHSLENALIQTQRSVQKEAVILDYDMHLHNWKSMLYSTNINLIVFTVC